MQGQQLARAGGEEDGQAPDWPAERARLLDSNRVLLEDNVQLRQELLALQQEHVALLRAHHGTSLQLAELQRQHAHVSQVQQLLHLQQSHSPFLASQSLPQPLHRGDGAREEQPPPPAPPHPQQRAARARQAELLGRCASASDVASVASRDSVSPSRSGGKPPRHKHKLHRRAPRRAGGGSGGRGPRPASRRALAPPPRRAPPVPTHSSIKRLGQLLSPRKPWGVGGMPRSQSAKSLGSGPSEGGEPGDAPAPPAPPRLVVDVGLLTGLTSPSAADGAPGGARLGAAGPRPSSAASVRASGSGSGVPPRNSAASGGDPAALLRRSCGASLLGSRREGGSGGGAPGGGGEGSWRSRRPAPLTYLRPVQSAAGAPQAPALLAGPATAAGTGRLPASPWQGDPSSCPPSVLCGPLWRDAREQAATPAACRYAAASSPGGSSTSGSGFSFSSSGRTARELPPPGPEPAGTSCERAPTPTGPRAAAAAAGVGGRGAASGRSSSGGSDAAGAALSSSTLSSTADEPRAPAAAPAGEAPPSPRGGRCSGGGARPPSPLGSGEGVLSRVVNWMINTKPIFEVFKLGAKGAMKSTTRAAGLDWDAHVAAMARDPELQRLCDEFAARPPGLTYPAYYTVPFHSYDDGNLNWQAAYEVEPASYAMALRTWKDEALTAEEAMARLRGNINAEIAGYHARHGVPAPGRLLDVGCSTGISSRWYQALYPDADITGLDLSPYFLAVAEREERRRAAPKRIRFERGLAEDTGYASGSWDAVVFSFIAHECPQAALTAFVAEARRLLRPGGVVVFVDNNPRSRTIQNLPPLLFTLMKSTEPWSDEYYSFDLEAALRVGGFASVETTEADHRHRTVFGIAA
ncbi:hypothetical protein HT031_003475 [Scenedesmus sp. PABB004]|nr:hypothetical protein HT031_003475 [Scenedesmus sp. PABB004]